MLERGRDLLEEEHRALGGEQLVLARDLLDLGDGLLDALDGGLRLPAEGVPAEASPELPWVTRTFAGMQQTSLAEHSLPRALARPPSHHVKSPGPGPAPVPREPRPPGAPPAQRAAAQQRTLSPALAMIVAIGV